jgi:glycine hydroxymethyltransferase
MSENIRDQTVFDAIRNERKRQENTLTLIASENHLSEDVMEAQGSVLTNKYAEGYPGSRYYAGCKNADVVEEIAIERAKELWGAEHVNVQPHSGSQANQAVYLAELEPGDTILSLKLSHGGHLSHGSPVNFSGQVYNSEHYEVDTDSGRLDYDSISEEASEVNPDMIVSGFSAYPREVNFERIQNIADNNDASHMADIAHITGLVATGLHNNPVGVADYVTGSTHKTIRSGRGGIIMTDKDRADDVDKAVFPGSQGGPAMHCIAGKAVGFGEALTDEFEEYCEQILSNSTRLSNVMKENGFELVSDGTDNHIVLIDFQDSHPELTGKRAENCLADAGIIANKNTVPSDSRSPFVTSGLRLGTPAITTRGFDAEDTEDIAQGVCDILNSPDDESIAERVEGTVSRLCEENPVYE